MNQNKALEIKGMLTEEILLRPHHVQKSFALFEGFDYPHFIGKTPNVQGIGIGFSDRKNYFIKVFANKMFRINEVLINYLEVPRGDVVVSQSGEMKIQQVYPGHYRPAFPGSSIGHPLVTAGTFGCLVTNGKSLFILSNNHVLANSNHALIGDDIIQPGTADGGTVANNLIAKLSGFVPIVFMGINQVDAAIAEPLNHSDVTTVIPHIGSVNGITAPRLGMQVVKCGRTSGLTFGTITTLGITQRINFGIHQPWFEEQFEVTGENGLFSDAGDSGSLIVELSTKKAVGLLFAGSQAGSTFANPISSVLETLNVQLL